MAGLYYDELPGRRVGYHLDGSVVNTWVDTNFMFSKHRLSQEDCAAMNNEDLDFFIPIMPDPVHDYEYWYLAIIFPIVLDLVGFFIAATGENQTDAIIDEILVGKNSTNGQDGEWIVLETDDPEFSFPYTPVKLPGTFDSMEYRNEIIPLSVKNIGAIRFKFPKDNTPLWVKAFHIYGTPSLSTVWDINTEYALGDIVTHDSSVYASRKLTVNIGNHPSIQSVDWIIDQSFNERLAWCAAGGGAELTLDKDFRNQNADGGSNDTEKYNVCVKNFHNHTAIDVHLKREGPGIMAHNDWNYQTYEWHLYNITFDNTVRLPDSQLSWRALYWELLVSGETRTVHLYNSTSFSANTMVATGTRSGYGKITLVECGRSGIFGSVMIADVLTPLTDTGVDNILEIAIDCSAVEYFDFRLTSDPDVEASYAADLDIGDIEAGAYTNVTIREKIPRYAVLGPHAVLVYIDGPDHWE